MAYAKPYITLKWTAAAIWLAASFVIINGLACTDKRLSLTCFYTIAASAIVEPLVLNSEHRFGVNGSINRTRRTTSATRLIQRPAHRHGRSQFPSDYSQIPQPHYPEWPHLAAGKARRQTAKCRRL